MSAPAVLFVIDPLSSLDPRGDSTVAMMREALRRGLPLAVAVLDDLALHGNVAWAHVREVVADPREAGASKAPPKTTDAEAGTPGDGTGPAEGAPARERVAELAAVGPRVLRPLRDFAFVFMRKDPPFDSNYLTATWMLEHAGPTTWVINDPRGLRDLNEKLSMLDFPELTPPTRILRKVPDLMAALDEWGGRMVVKPVFGYGGRGVLHARRGDPNLSALLEVATGEGRLWTVAQAFVPEAGEGDKRILLVDGEPIGAVLRVPAPGEGRNNFHAGGSPQRTTLDDHDRKICAAVGPWLRARGQFFAGIDVLGGRLTEINVTSPTGMREIDRLEGLVDANSMAGRMFEALLARFDRGEAPAARS